MRSRPPRERAPTGPRPGWCPLDERWNAPVGGLPSAAPVVSGDRVVLPVAGARLDAFDLADGAAAWSAPLATTRALAVGGGLVFAATAEGVTAVDLERGTPAWRAGLGAQAAAPCWHAGWVIAGTAAGNLVALRAADGGVVWTRELGGVPSAAASVEGDRVYVPLADGRVRAFAIEDGAPVWEVRLRQTGAMVLPLADRVYVGSLDNDFYCFRARDGRLLWAWRTGGDVVGGAAVDDARVYFVSRDNVVYALDRGSGVLQWRKALPTRPLGPPSLADGRVFVPLGAEALHFYPADGKGADITVELPADLFVASAFGTDHDGVPLVVATVDLQGAVVLRGFGRGGLATLAPLGALETLPGTEVGLPDLPEAGGQRVQRPGR